MNKIKNGLLVAIFLMGFWNVSTAQIQDTFLLERNPSSIKIVHTILTGDSIFPDFEIDVKPASFLAMNSTTLGHEVGGRYRWNNLIHFSASYCSEISEYLMLRSIPNFQTPMHNITAELGYTIFGSDLETSRRKVNVFVGKGKGKEKVQIINRELKRYNIVPTVGLNWKRFQPMSSMKRNADGVTFFCGDAKVMNVNLGVHVDISKAYRTLANSKRYTRIRRGSLDIGLTYALSSNFQWYERGLYDSPYTYYEVNADDIPQVKMKPLGWYWRYNYTIGLNNNGGITLGAQLGKLPRQSLEASEDFDFNETTNSKGYLFALSAGYTFSSKVFR